MNSSRLNTVCGLFLRLENRGRHLPAQAHHSSSVAGSGFQTLLPGNQPGHPFELRVFVCISVRPSVRTGAGAVFRSARSGPGCTLSAGRHALARQAGERRTRGLHSDVAGTVTFQTSHQFYLQRSDADTTRRRAGGGSSREGAFMMFKDTHW